MSQNKPIYAIKVTQPYGYFYQVSLSAEALLNCTYVNQAKIEDGDILGVQRKESVPRAREIAKFIDSKDAAFPNSIILSVNYDENEIPLPTEKKWIFEHIEADLYKLIIPDDKVRACSIIDGQHRLLGFGFSKNNNIHLPCSIYDSLPPSGQASIFATINFNQQKVPKSLAYRLFGYSLSETERHSWSPDLLAVYFSEKFNTSQDSAFHNHLNSRLINEKRSDEWSVSSSVFIDGFITLISRRPKVDRYIINSISAPNETIGRQRISIQGDDSPLRSMYIDGNDRAIEQIVDAYFKAASEVFWITSTTVMTKSVGISALFDFLRFKLSEMPVINMLSLNDLCSSILNIQHASFDNKDEYPSTTVGRKKILNHLIKITEKN